MLEDKIFLQWTNADVLWQSSNKIYYINSFFYERIKHIETYCHLVREGPIQDQAAILTKTLDKGLFVKLLFQLKSIDIYKAL
jgi:hypothetical protein